MNILAYCKTDKQKKVYSEYLKNNKDISKTSKKLNISYDSVRGIIRRVNAEYELDVFKDSVENVTDELNNVDYDNNMTTSTSTLYDKDGNIINKWVKKKNTKDELHNIYKAYIEEYCKALPKYSPVKKNNNTYEKLLAVYPFTDLHLGMYSWFEETGTSYDLKIAEDLVKKTITKLMDRSPSCEECLITNLGDFLHVDNVFNKTPTNGNFLDADGRYSKIMNLGIKIMRYIIEYALIKHNHVTVINCIGNHDQIGSMWISAALQNIYENESCITIINSPAPRQYYKYGNTLIGMTHGNDCKGQNLPIVMATEKPIEWGSTKYHTWYTGHYHQDRVFENCGCKVECFRTIAGKDAWSNANGFLDGRSICCIMYDPEYGECERYTVNI